MGIPSPQASVTTLWGPKALNNMVDMDLRFEVEKERNTIHHHLPRYIEHWFVYLCKRLISQWHTAVPRNQKVHLRSSQQQQIMRILWSWNPMKWESVRWSVSRPAISLTFRNCLWKLTECCSNKNRLCHCHHERGSNPVSICSCGDPSTILQEAIEVALNIQVCEVRWILHLKVARWLIKFLIRKHWMFNKRLKSCKVSNLMIIVVDYVMFKDEEGSKELLWQLRKVLNKISKNYSGAAHE